MSDEPKSIRQMVIDWLGIDPKYINKIYPDVTWGLWTFDVELPDELQEQIEATDEYKAYLDERETVLVKFKITGDWTRTDIT